MARTAEPPGERRSDIQRRERRVSETKIALVRFADEECLGTIENVSMNGVRVALFTRIFPEESDIVVDGSYEDDWVTFRGRVRYAATHPGGWTVGVECDDDSDRRRFLAARYQV